MSLRLTLKGLTTDRIHVGERHFALERDLAASRLCAEIAGQASFEQPLGKQTAEDLAGEVTAYLQDGGVVINVIDVVKLETNGHLRRTSFQWQCVPELTGLGYTSWC